jgi:hypothetical protein
MQPRSHAFVIEAACVRAASPWPLAHLGSLLQGHLDEDDLVLPFGLRLRAAGLTHSYRPGSWRGELLAPSALVCLARCLRRARRAPTEPAAAWWLGRACHLVGDLAIPSRTRGVWHLLGDPLESWLEEHTDALPSLVPTALVIPRGSPSDLARELARASAGLAADTTRTPWGAWAFRRGHGTRLTADEVAAQAAVLVPLAVAATTALLDGFAAGRPTPVRCGP